MHRTRNMNRLDLMNGDDDLKKRIEALEKENRVLWDAISRSTKQHIGPCVRGFRRPFKLS